MTLLDKYGTPISEVQEKTQEEKEQEILSSIDLAKPKYFISGVQQQELLPNGKYKVCGVSLYEKEETAQIVLKYLNKEVEEGKKEAKKQNVRTLKQYRYIIVKYPVY